MQTVIKYTFSFPGHCENTLNAQYLVFGALLGNPHGIHVNTLPERPEDIDEVEILLPLSSTFSGSSIQGKLLSQLAMPHIQNVCDIKIDRKLGSSAQH
jgi:hypothetical protein